MFQKKGIGENPILHCPLCGSDQVKTKRTSNACSFVVCRICSLCFTHPYPENSSLFDDYFWTKEYTDNFDEYIEPIFNSFKIKIQKVEHIIQRKVRSFLDVGCGNGLYLYAADRFGIKNIGTDIDNKNIEFARRKGLNAICIPIEKLETTNRFDFIHLKSVLHLVECPKTMIEVTRKLLSPDGLIYIEVPNQASLFSLLRKFRDRNTFGQLQPPFRNRAYSMKTLKYLLRETGLLIRQRDFPYPSDKVYYPLMKINSAYALVFQMFSRIHISSLIGIYAGHATL